MNLRGHTHNTRAHTHAHTHGNETGESESPCKLLTRAEYKLVGQISYLINIIANTNEGKGRKRKCYPHD